MDLLIEHAMMYRGFGLSIVPVTSNKNPIGEWRRLQNDIMTESETLEAFGKPGVRGIAIVCGSGSGNFEGLDIDSRNDPGGTLMYEFATALQNENPFLYGRLPIAITKNNGYHLYYRSNLVSRDLVLARRPPTPEELTLNPKSKPKVLIEMKAMGGIIVVPPTRGYRFLQHDLFNIPLLKDVERQLLFDIATAFNQISRREPTPKTRIIKPYPEDESPFYDFDDRCDHSYFKDLLERHGWIFVETVPPRSYYLRPGRTDQRTSGNYHHEMKLFKVFSPNAGFVPAKAYRPHVVFTILECNWNFIVAAKLLSEMGYGKRYKRA